MIARVMLAIVVAGVVTFGSTTAQNNEASPDRQAPADSLSASTIDDVDGLLAWARKEIG